MFKEIIEQIDYNLGKKSLVVEKKIIKYELSEVKTNNKESDFLFRVRILMDFSPSDPEQLIYYNFYITPNDGINVIVHGGACSFICRQYVENIDDFESTVLQFSTIINMYDLDKTYYSVLLKIRDDFLEKRTKSKNI
ncbi:hypothetical protein GAP32_449 [Cronobacter phage vB_CsaM_GAP32]|uniref:Uncharacterized protein n=1 Tax=Cronobacter phage vB_CsaM_GAP32 TaxID=1141136 RepID=K4FB85_9CAUD|nr:hypothetical protein GAP32_449 [Cronobacter phage vB_CsaM_GAP32]AFC21904.1 hypothetical protein GAP32_449 [Cronobacter phage vB_CsaM_GAP32]